MQNDPQHEIPYDMFYMHEKDEPELHAQHPKKLLERAFGAKADAQNGDYSQNTTAWD